MNSLSNRIQILTAFPNLVHDKNWTITSPIDKQYNCIAWAAQKSDNFWWPHKGVPGVYWPNDISMDRSLDSFIQLFGKLGYEQCNDHQFEANYFKLALYLKDGLCSHASRQISEMEWTSKLGQQFDISHSTPFSIEGQMYGKVAAFLRKQYDL